MLEAQQQLLTILDPITNQLFPSLTVGNRLCVAVVAGRPFAIRVAGHSHSRTEAVLAVDGRDTLTNQPANPSASGIIFTGQYVCKGFPAKHVLGGEGVGRDLKWEPTVTTR